MRASAFLLLFMPLLLLGCVGSAGLDAAPSWNFVLQAIPVAPAATPTARPIATSGAPATPAPSPSPTPHIGGYSGGGGAPRAPAPPGLGVIVQDGGLTDPSASPTLAVGP